MYFTDYSLSTYFWTPVTSSYKVMFTSSNFVSKTFHSLSPKRKLVFEIKLAYLCFKMLQTNLMSTNLLFEILFK